MKRSKARSPLKRPPAWADEPVYVQGYGPIGHQLLRAPMWLEPEELWSDASHFKSPRHHHASLMLRAAQWINGPLEVATIRTFLFQVKGLQQESFVRDLLANGWVVDDGRIYHAVTEERRRPLIERLKRGDIRPRRAQSKRTRFRVLEEHGFACRYCGRRAPQVELHVDHIHPVSRGGDDDPANLVAACADCNMGKADRVIGGGE